MASRAHGSPPRARRSTCWRQPRTLWYRQCLACSRRAADFTDRAAKENQEIPVALTCLCAANDRCYPKTRIILSGHSRKQHWRKDYLIPSPLSWERARGEVARRASKIALRLRHCHNAEDVVRIILALRLTRLAVATPDLPHNRPFPSGIELARMFRQASFSGSREIATCRNLLS